MSPDGLTVRRQIRLSAAMHERLQALAQEQSVSVSALIRMAVARCLFAPADATIRHADVTDGGEEEVNG